MAMERTQRSERTQGKILVRMWTPLRQALDKRIEDACLKRDGFLDKVFRHEAEALEHEMTTANTEEGERELKRLLAEFLTQNSAQVNLSLSKKTADAIDAACQHKRVPRDTFINRVLYFLVMPDRAITSSLFEFGTKDDWFDLHMRLLESYPEERNVAVQSSTLRIASALPNLDPFWYVRRRIDVARRESPELPMLHGARITPWFFKGVDRKEWLMQSVEWLNCCLPDERIEGTEAHTRLQERVAQMLEEMFGDDKGTAADAEPPSRNARAKGQRRRKS